MSDFVIEDVALADIKTSPLYQSRVDAELDEEHVAGMPADVDVKDPIELYRIKGVRFLMLVGGNHRIRRIEQTNRTIIRAKVYRGSELDAFWNSCGQNRDHGLKRSEKDIESMAFKAFDLRKSGKVEWFADLRIAEALHVGASWISKLRQRWEAMFPGKHPPKSSNSSPPAPPKPPSPPSTLPPQPPIKEPDLDIAEEDGGVLGLELQEALKGKRKRDHRLLTDLRKRICESIHALQFDLAAHDQLAGTTLAEQARPALAKVMEAVGG